MEMQQFITILRPARIQMITDGPTEFEEKTVSLHFNYLKELVNNGIVHLAGLTQTNDYKTFGIVIFFAADIAEARSLVENDPAVKMGVMNAEVYPFRIALPVSDQTNQK
jgi:uncharacterized protein YciI